MINALRGALARAPEPKRVTVKTWRDDARHATVSLGARERINVAHPKARFVAHDPHTAYTAWANPGRIGAGFIWLVTVGALAVYGRKTGRGPLSALNNWEPFSAIGEER